MDAPRARLPVTRIVSGMVRDLTAAAGAVPAPAAPPGVGDLMDRIERLERAEGRPRVLGPRRRERHRPGAGPEEVNFREHMVEYTRKEFEAVAEMNRRAFDRAAAERDAARELARSRSRPALRRSRAAADPVARYRLRLLGLDPSRLEQETQSQRPASGTDRREFGRARFLRTCRSTGVLSVRHTDERERRPRLPDLTMPAVARRAGAANGGHREMGTQTTADEAPTPRMLLAANLMPETHADSLPYYRGRQVGDWAGGDPRFAWVRNAIPNPGRPVRELEVGQRLSPRTRTKNLWQRVNPGFDDRRADTGPSTRMEDFDDREEELEREYRVMQTCRSLRKISNTVY